MADMGNIEEWEYVDVLPQHEVPRPKIAGNYGPASNIWQIGMVSFQILPDDQHDSTIMAYTDLVASVCTIW